MEITSFILGVCVVIILLMVMGTSVNYMTTKVLKKDLGNLQREQELLSMEILDKTNNLESKITREIEHLDGDFMKNIENVHRTIDSRSDKLDNKFMDEIKVLILETQSLSKELDRVERGYKEKINY